MQQHPNILEGSAEIRDLLLATTTIAVLGIKPEDRSGQPAFYVPRYLLDVGYDVIPVPVYYPAVTEILGRKVYRSLVDIPGDVDLVNIFRRPEHLQQHVDDILAKKPRAVWFQLGIYNDDVARQLAEAGILVVQDHCIMVEHRHYV